MKFDELFKTDKKFKNFIEKVGKTSSYEKMAFKKQNGFTIADDNVKIITSDSIVSYTMAIKRDDNKSSLSFENLVIQEKANTNLKAYILKYYPSKMTSTGHQSFYLESNIEIKRLEGFTGFKKNKSQNKTSESDCYINVDQLWCSQPFAGSSKHHLAGASCKIATLYVISIKVLAPDQCGSTGGGASSGSTGSDGGFGAPYGTPGGGGYNNNYPSENPTNPNYDENYQPVLTTPVLNSENSFNIKNERIFYSNLNPHQQYWAGNNLNSYSQIIQYQIDNQWSEKSKAFANFAIKFLNDNSEVTWWQFENWFMGDNPAKEGEENIDPNLITFEPQVTLGTLPSFNDFINAFPKNGVSGNYSQMLANEVYSLVKGSLLNSYINEPTKYSNACSIRGSRGLLYSKITIPVLKYNGLQRTQKGGDLKNYILDAVSFDTFMKAKFGETQNVLSGVNANDPEEVARFLKGKNGIYVIVNNDPKKYELGGAGYSGHVDTIIDGICIGAAYTRPQGGVKSIKIWTLK